MPWIILATGIALLVLAAVGLITGAVYFIGRDNVLRLIDRDSELYLYWALETIYVFCGTVMMAYGFKEIRDEREFKKII